jgi:hypothetical protein
MAPQQADPKYMLEFACKDAPTIQKDGLGQRIFQLWRIWNKYTSRSNQGVYYELQLWEEINDGCPNVRMASAAEAKHKYGQQIQDWEAKHGKQWKAEYKDGNLFDPQTKRTFDYSPKKTLQPSKRLRTYGKSNNTSLQLDDDPIHSSSPPTAGEDSGLDSSKGKPNSTSIGSSGQFASRPVFRMPQMYQRPSTRKPQSSMVPPAKPTSMQRQTPAVPGRQITGVTQGSGMQHASSKLPTQDPSSDSSKIGAAAGAPTGPQRQGSSRRLVGSVNTPSASVNPGASQQNAAVGRTTQSTRGTSSQIPLPRAKPGVQMQPAAGGNLQQGVTRTPAAGTSSQTNQGPVAPAAQGSMPPSPPPPNRCSNKTSRVSMPQPPIPPRIAPPRSQTRVDPAPGCLPTPGQTSSASASSIQPSPNQTSSAGKAQAAGTGATSISQSKQTLQPKQQSNTSGAGGATQLAGHGASHIPLVANSSVNKATTADTDAPTQQPQIANAGVKRASETSPRTVDKSVGPIRSSIEADDDSDIEDSPDAADDARSQIDEIRAIRAESVSYFASQSKQGVVDEFEKTTGQVLNSIFLQTLDESQQDTANINDDDGDDDDAPSGMATPAPGVVVDTLERYSEKLIQAQKDSLNSLVRTTLDLKGFPDDRWVERRKDSNIDFAAFEQSIRSMLASFDSKVLKHLVMGDIPRAARQDRQLEKALRKLMNMEKKTRCPSIYIQYLVDNQGFSPTPKKLYEILDDAEKYTIGFQDQSNTDSSDFAKKIEGRTLKSIFNVQGRPTGERKYVKKKEHVTNITAWLAATRARLHGCPQDEPLARPLCEVGYATKPVERLERHSKHQSSNYIMNLTEAICKTKFPQYFIAQFVLFHMFHPVHAMVGEIICSRLSQCYTAHGGGFSHHAAGQSVAGASEMPVTYYRDLRNVVFSSPMYQDNMRKDIKAIGAKTEKLAELGTEAVAHVEELKELDGQLPENVSVLEEKQSIVQEFATRSAEITDPFFTVVNWFESIDAGSPDPDSQMMNM